ncbi:hypothetical protein [Streptomyces gilvus]|uniref:hypothetical protein n=1 Tax=Streptomyces gilvus TaxID=2920937 RepID=UPI001F102967|nr:hypothetical protein [Streptomyces sp. CME 23]MCH5675678.1 hypothetical protein [Streptomyces sp. CME 23]
MLALRLTRTAPPAVQLRRLLVTLASGGTGFLLLCSLGHALSHPASPSSSALRLAWCLTPLAATVQLAIAVSRTDPATKPRPGLSSIGLGPARLMTIAATTTALSTTLGSVLALLLFLYLRGDLTGIPFDGAAADALAADRPLPVPASVTLLSLVPVLASAAVALALRPRDTPPATTRGTARSYVRFGAHGGSAARETFGASGRFGARLHGGRPTSRPPTDGRGAEGVASARTVETPPDTPDEDPTRPPAPRTAPSGLPWGIATLAAGLAVEAYAGRTTQSRTVELPDGLTTATPAVLVGLALTVLGLALAAPALTHLTGRLLQSAGPGALRLLAGRVLMEEATRIGRPLGVVCAVASAAYAMSTLYDPSEPSFGPLATLGTVLVTGCTLATLLTAAVEARQARADTTAALVRLGAPATMLRTAAALRAAALLTLFTPLTLLVTDLAVLPLTR